MSRAWLLRAAFVGDGLVLQLCGKPSQLRGKAMQFRGVALERHWRML